KERARVAVRSPERAQLGERCAELTAPEHRTVERFDGVERRGGRARVACAAAARRKQEWSEGDDAPASDVLIALRADRDDRPAERVPDGGRADHVDEA